MEVFRETVTVPTDSDRGRTAADVRRRNPPSTRTVDDAVLTGDDEMQGILHSSFRRGRLVPAVAIGGPGPRCGRQEAWHNIQGVATEPSLSTEGEKMRKISIVVPISYEQASTPDPLVAMVAEMLDRWRNPRPDTPEEIAAREEWEAETQWIVQRRQEIHRQHVERAEPLAAAVLQLHAPSEERHARCLGCDYDGFEAEPPEFPCRTYRLVTGGPPEHPTPSQDEPLAVVVEGVMDPITGGWIFHTGTQF